MHPFISHLRILATLTSVIAVAGEMNAQAPLKESPFLPPANAAAPTKAGAAYELAGMSVAGKATLLSITRVSDKHSIWVAVGQSVGEVTAVSYDPKTDQATIRADGKLLTLSMRKSVVVGAPGGQQVFFQPIPAVNVAPTQEPQPAPVAIPSPPANAQEEKETEARMLVTDLLEIGQAQRKAYEEAQRQAAAKGTKPSPSPAKPPVSNQ
jgi:hypothetical protein